MGLRERQRDERRRHLLDVCEGLYRSKGFDATTVDDIVHAASISRQSFFNYFPSKESVLRELGLAWLARESLRVTATRRRTTSRHLLPRLREVVRAQLRALEQDRAFMALVFTRSGLFFPTGAEAGTDADESRRTRTSAALDAMAAAFREAQERGELRRDVDASQIAELYVGIFYVTVRLWLTRTRGTKDRLETRMLRAIDVLFNGLRPREASR
jgi:AcrR family transcriptional regulator